MRAIFFLIKKRSYFGRSASISKANIKSQKTESSAKGRKMNGYLYTLTEVQKNHLCRFKQLIVIKQLIVKDNKRVMRLLFKS